MIQVKKKRLRIKDVFQPLNGIFSAMNFDFKIIEKSQLDLLFFNFYGQRALSPFCCYYLSEDLDNVLTDIKKEELAKSVESYYKLNWEKLLAILELEYDPIHNFSDTLHEDIQGTDDKILTDNYTLTQQGNGSIKREDNLQSVDTKDLSDTTTGTNEDKFAGFNSTTYKNKDQEVLNTTVKTTGTDTVVDTGTQTKTEQRNFQDINEGRSVSDVDYTKKRDVTRIGNIGNITTQQMIQQEIELWKWNIIKTILENVRDLVTLAVYL